MAYIRLARSDITAQPNRHLNHHRKMIDFPEKASYHHGMETLYVNYVNGEWLPANALHLSVEERGFRFGDGVFETMRLHQGQIPHLARHLSRLKRGLEAIQMTEPTVDLSALCAEMIQRNHASEGALRLHISRGIGSRGYRPTPPIPPCVVMELLPPAPRRSEPHRLGLSQWRKPSPRALPVNYKISQGLNSTLAIMEAESQDASEALLLSSEGDYLCEAASANLFWRKDGTLYTPALSTGCLAGIAREILLEQTDTKTGEYPLAEVERADAVMICNSVQGAMPVQSLAPHGWKWPDSTRFASEMQELIDAA